jgi:hypothetical protein
MKKVLLFLMLLCSLLFAKSTIYTEGCYFGYMSDDGTVEITDSISANKGKWSFDNDMTYFVCRSDIQTVKKTKYLIDQESIFETFDGGVYLEATEKNSNIPYQFLFSAESIVVFVDFIDNGEQTIYSVIVFKVKKYK